MAGWLNHDCSLPTSPIWYPIDIWKLDKKRAARIISRLPEKGIKKGRVSLYRTLCRKKIRPTLYQVERFYHQGNRPALCLHDRLTLYQTQLFCALVNPSRLWIDSPQLAGTIKQWGLALPASPHQPLWGIPPAKAGLPLPYSVFSTITSLRYASTGI